MLKERIRPFSMKKALVLSVLLASGYGLLMEAAQGFTSSRNFSLWDALANTLGASAGAVYIIYVNSRRR